MKIKEVLKKNKLICLSTIILILIGLWCAIDYRVSYDTEIKKSILINELIDKGELKPPLEGWRSRAGQIDNAFNTYFNLWGDERALRFFPRLLPLFIIIPCSYAFYRKLNSGVIKGELTRKSYNKFLKDEYKKAIKAVLIFPIFVLVTIFFCYLVTGKLALNFEIDYEKWLYYCYGGSMIDNFNIRIFPIFFLNYLVTIMFFAGHHVNVALIFIKKKMPYIVSVIAATLTIIGLEIFMEIVFSNICYYIFELESDIAGIFNMHSIFLASNDVNISGLLIYRICLYAISLGILWLTYHNKEKVLIQNEL